MRKKVTVIGSGNVGASVAQLIAHEGLADVLLFDITEGMPQGKALDLSEACPLWNSSVSVTGTNSYADTSGSAVIAVTAGFPRKPGMSRDDLLHANAGVIRETVSGISALSPDSILIIVTNPMDVMAQVAWKVSGFAPHKIIGMGGILDSSRFRTFISLETKISPSDIEALVMGGHGDLMVPMPRFTTVKGVPLPDILPKDKIDRLIERTRQGGAEIVNLLKTGSAYYAPAAATYHMIKAVLLDQKRVFPCAAYLDGQYGVRGTYVGVPVVLGENGVERIIELDLNEAEERDFRKSVSSVQNLLGIIEFN